MFLILIFIWILLGLAYSYLFLKTLINQCNFCCVVKYSLYLLILFKRWSWVIYQISISYRELHSSFPFKGEMRLRSKRLLARRFKSLINGISAAIFDHELLEAQRGVQFVRGRLSGICEEVLIC